MRERRSIYFRIARLPQAPVAAFKFKGKVGLSRWQLY
jgi:hypothetical protein